MKYPNVYFRRNYLHGMRNNPYTVNQFLYSIILLFLNFSLAQYSFWFLLCVFQNIEFPPIKGNYFLKLFLYIFISGFNKNLIIIHCSQLDS